MEPENHPFGKEKTSSKLNLHFGGFHVNFQGCIFLTSEKKKTNGVEQKRKRAKHPTELRPLESSNRIEAHSHFLNLMRTQGADAEGSNKSAQGVSSENKQNFASNFQPLGMECKKFPVFFATQVG